MQIFFGFSIATSKFFKISIKNFSKFGQISLDLHRDLCACSLHVALAWMVCCLLCISRSIGLAEARGAVEVRCFKSQLQVRNRAEWLLVRIHLKLVRLSCNKGTKKKTETTLILTIKTTVILVLTIHSLGSLYHDIGSNIPNSRRQYHQVL